jgi:orotate phosphoribosyltransferase
MKYFDIIDELYEIGSIKFGSFKLKSGAMSPFYVDLRLIISYPKLLTKIAEALWNKVSHLPINRVCGVPYTALPIATCISITHNIPMLLKRKEVKDYGTKQLIEGYYHEGDGCLIIEDIVTSGKSILETIEPLQTAGLNIASIVIIIDREQGGLMAIEKQGFHVTPLMTITDVWQRLKLTGKLSQADVDKARKFVEHNQVDF